jgi:hypothetical protein
MMKIAKLISITLTSVILSALTGIAIVSEFDKQETARFFEQERIKIPKTYTAASISKGTLLLLLAVGIIGALGVSRKIKVVQNNENDKPAENADSVDHNQTPRNKKS